MTEQIYPGAYHVPIGGNGKRLTVFPGEDIFHIVAASWNIDVSQPFNTGYAGGYWENNHPCNTYTDQFGAMQQFAEYTEQVNGTLNGNYRNRTHEAWNPKESDGDLNLSRYSDEQAERFADWLYWGCKANGKAIVDMGNSRASSHGVGVHRYGITGYYPYNLVGGEVWSTSSNKVCPGTARIQQMKDEIIPRAIWLFEHDVDYLPTGRVHLPTALARGKGNVPIPVTKDDGDMLSIVKADNSDGVWCGGPGLWTLLTSGEQIDVLVKTGQAKPLVVLTTREMDVFRDWCKNVEARNDAEVVGPHAPTP